MKKASIIMAVLSCAIIAAAYTNSVPISTNTRAATEKWTAIRFEPALPPTPENAASKFLNGNREWQTAADIQAVSNALAPYATTQQVAEAAAAIPRDRITTIDGSQWIDATGGVWRVTTSTVPDTSRLVIWHNIPGTPWPSSFMIDPFDTENGYNEFVGSRWLLNLRPAGSVSSSYVQDYETGDTWWAVADSDPLDYPVTLEKADESSALIAEYATSTVVTTSRVDGVAWQSDLAPYATTQQVEATTAALAVHTNRADNPHGVTAAQVGALTAEQDLAALRAYHYGSPDIIESPAEWFVFNGAGTITAFNWEAGRENVVIPWKIGGVPVTAIGDGAFQASGITSAIAPQTVTVIGDYAFADCYSLASVLLPQVRTVGYVVFGNCNLLTSVSLPQATSIGDYAFYYCYTLTSVTIPQATSIGNNAFYYCTSLTSVTIPQATSIGDYAFVGCEGLTSIHMGQNAPAEATDVFYGITTPPKVYVTNPQATGWGDTWNGAPVVRPPLYAEAIYQAGELVATEAHVAQAIAAIPEPDLSDRPTFAQIAASNALPYTAWTGTVTPQNGTATVTYAHGNMPVLVTDAPCVLTLDPTGYGTAGVSRVSLSYYTGTNSFTFATNVITYSATPNVDTNGWNTLLIRRVSDGAWKGVGL